MPALKAGSKSRASTTRLPGVTRNGAMNSAIRLCLMSAMWCLLLGREGMPPAQTMEACETAVCGDEFGVQIECDRGQVCIGHAVGSGAGAATDLGEHAGEPLRERRHYCSGSAEDDVHERQRVVQGA